MERAESANANHTFDRAPDRWMQKMISKIFAESAHYPPPPDLRPPQFPRGVYSELVVPSAPRAADFGHPFAVQPAAAGPPGSGIAPAPGMCTNTREWVAHPPYGLVGSVNGVRSVKREVSSVNRGQRGWMNGWIDRSAVRSPDRSRQLLKDFLGNVWRTGNGITLIDRCNMAPQTPQNGNKTDEHRTSDVEKIRMSGRIACEHEIHKKIR
eukprot:gene22860-biopygen20778